MIELFRIVSTDKLYSYRATQDKPSAEQLDLLMEMNLPINWHPLISDSFKYQLAQQEARFRPSIGKSVFYGSLIEETALYESAYYLIKEHRLLNVPGFGSRTVFSVDAANKNAFDIKNESNSSSIMDKTNYSASHQFVLTNPNITFILYPSCRDPQQRNNAAILDINHLEKNPKWETTINFFYESDQLTWLDYQLSIHWDQVS